MKTNNTCCIICSSNKNSLFFILFENPSNDTCVLNEMSDTSTTPSCNGPPNESCNINHNIRHCSFIYALHIPDIIYEGVF